MKKILFLLLAATSAAFGDTKISALPSTTSMNTSDIIPVVVNPGTTPANKIITFQNFYNSIPSTVTAASIGALTTSSATATYLQLSSAAATYLQSSSATATYLQQSSATATYLQISSATANYPKLGAGNLFTQSNTYSSSSTFNGAVIVSTSINAGGQGTSGQFLTSGGPNAVVSWTSGGSGDVVKASTQVFTGGNTFISSTTFSGTVLLNSSSSIRGTTTNDDAASGFIGETLSSGTAQGSALGLTTGSGKSIGGVSLTPGEWAITVLGSFSAANTTQLLDENIAINTVNNATPSGVSMFPNAAGLVSMENDVKITASGTTLFPMVLHVIAKVAVTASYFAVMTSDFNTSTASVFGSIVAIRVR